MLAWSQSFPVSRHQGASDLRMHFVPYPSALKQGRANLDFLLKNKNEYLHEARISSRNDS